MQIIAFITVEKRLPELEKACTVVKEQETFPDGGAPA